MTTVAFINMDYSVNLLVLCTSSLSLRKYFHLRFTEWPRADVAVCYGGSALRFDAL